MEKKIKNDCKIRAPGSIAYSKTFTNKINNNMQIVTRTFVFNKSIMWMNSKNNNINLDKMVLTIARTKTKRTMDAKRQTDPWLRSFAMEY